MTAEQFYFALLLLAPVISVCLLEISEILCNGLMSIARDNFRTFLRVNLAALGIT